MLSAHSDLPALRRLLFEKAYLDIKSSTGARAAPWPPGVSLCQGRGAGSALTRPRHPRQAPLAAPPRHCGTEARFHEYRHEHCSRGGVVQAVAVSALLRRRCAAKQPLCPPSRCAAAARRRPGCRARTWLALPHPHTPCPAPQKPVGSLLKAALSVAGVFLAGWLLTHGAPLLKDETRRRETVRRVKEKVGWEGGRAAGRGGGCTVEQQAGAAAPTAPPFPQTTSACEPCLLSATVTRLAASPATSGPHWDLAKTGWERG